MKEIRKYAIGDIHGCYLTFKELFYNLLNPTIDDEIYILGDMIDRGPSSKELIDEISLLKEKGFNIYPLIGNHEKFLLDSLQSHNSFLDWAYNGSESTLHSFNIQHPYQLEKKYLDFFKSLPYYYIVDDYVLVHAGLNFFIENPLNDLNSMLWNREEYVNRSLIGNRRVVCGHTPSTPEKVRSSLLQDKIFLDGGCVYKGRHFGYGFLFALELVSQKLYSLQNIDW